MFRIGTWGAAGWAVCAFRIDDETGVGAYYQLDRVAAMFHSKYSITGEGDLHRTLGIGAVRDYDTYIISISPRPYIGDLVQRFSLQNAHRVTTPLTGRDFYQRCKGPY